MCNWHELEETLNMWRVTLTNGETVDVEPGRSPSSLYWMRVEFVRWVEA